MSIRTENTDVVRVGGRILKAGGDDLRFDIAKILEDFCLGGPRLGQVRNIHESDTNYADAESQPVSVLPALGRRGKADAIVS